MKTRAMRVVVELQIHGGDDEAAEAVRDAIGQRINDDFLTEICTPFVDDKQVAGVSWDVRGQKPDKYEGLAMVSTGDPEKDKKEIEDHIRSSERMEDGVCPNGCALMTKLDDHSRQCPVCNFVGWQNIPLE